jgi:hypothetical protein
MKIRPWVLASTIALTLAASAALAQPPASAPVDEAMNLYLAVASGKQSFQSLTPEQQREVRIVAALMARPRYTSQKCQDLADKQDEAQSAAEDLQNCLLSGDDDCDSQMQEARDAHDDYEDALDATDGDCQ